MAENPYTLNPNAHWILPNERSAYSDWIRDSVNRLSGEPSSYLQALAQQRIAEILENNRPVNFRLADVGPNTTTRNTTNNATNNATPDPTQDRPPVVNAIHNTNDNHNMWEELTTRQRVVAINPDGDTVTLRPMYSYNSDVQSYSNAYTNSDYSDTHGCYKDNREEYHKELINEFREAMPQYDKTPQTLHIFKDFIATKGLADITDSENQLIIELANIALLSVLKRNNTLTKEIKEYKAQAKRALDSVEVLRKEKDNLRIDYERAQIDLTRIMMGHEKDMQKKDDEIAWLKQLHARRMAQPSPDNPNRISDSETLNPTIGPGDYLDYLGPNVTWEGPHLRVNHGNTGTTNMNIPRWSTRLHWD